MTNFCVRCEKTHPLDHMVTVANPYHNGPHWIDVDVDCIILGDRIIDTDAGDDD